MAKFKGLGKGLDALLSASKANMTLDAYTLPGGSENKNQLRELTLSVIQPGRYQPRRIFDEEELQELANSIMQNGVIQAVVVRAIGEGRYELIAGERRWRACRLAGLATIPAVIREFSDEEALAVSLIENIQRKDLNIVEEAEGYRRLIDEFGLTHESLAQVSGKSRSSISNTLRLLNLAAPILEMLLVRKLDMGHARALLPLSEEQQLILAAEIVTKKLTTAEVENKVARMLQSEKFAGYSGREERKDPDIQRLEETIADKIGMMVAIKHNRSGNGKISIRYSSLDELDNLLSLLS